MNDKVIQILMAVSLVAMLFVAILLTGCNTGKAIENAGHKSLVGDGYLAINKITVTDPTTGSYTPQLFSLFLSGKYISVLKDAPFLYYTKKSSTAVLNSNAVTTEECIVIQVRGNETVKGVLEELMKKGTAEAVLESSN